MTIELKYLLYCLFGFFLLTNAITGLAVNSCDIKKRLETEKELAIKTEQLNNINELMQEIDKTKPKKNKFNPTAYHISRAIYQSYQEYPILNEFSYGEIIRLIKKESNFKTDATSSKGAKSIMQLMPATAKRMGVKDIIHPYDNTKGGMKYLAYLLQKYKSKKLALYAYYTGETNLNWHLRQGKIPTYLIEYAEGIL
jgi:soluble lytic murein transglycosylase-like protein